MTHPLVVVVGPTGVGKTDLALQLARHFDGELVGADSIQVYRGFDIGSAKPTRSELAGISHHLIDVLEPTDFMDAVLFAEQADAVVSSIWKRGKLPIVVGGTGLWIRAFLRGLLDVPPPDAQIRERLARDCMTLGSAAMHARLAEVDELAAAKIHVNDAFRILRALEIYEQTGKPAGLWRQEHALGQERYPSLVLHLCRDVDNLNERIIARVDRMLELGFEGEVRSLLERYSSDARAFGSVGYKEMVQFVLGNLSAEEMRRQMIRSTRIYARRQRTWFQSEKFADGADSQYRSLAVGDDVCSFVEAYLQTRRSCP